MAGDGDEEITQDFLIEAGEIAEKLGEQLVELEQRSRDTDLLNAVFRGFHTIKGGAGFLGLAPMVEVCHRAEDVFNTLRQGKRTITPQLMDVVLRVLDIVRAMLDQVRAGEELMHAEPELLRTLDMFAKEQEADEPVVSAAPPAKTPAMPSPPSSAGGDEITEAEFEALLDQLHGAAPKDNSAHDIAINAAIAAAKSGSDEISEQEFDALLDTLQSAARATAASPAAMELPVAPVATPPPIREETTPTTANSPAISKENKDSSQPQAETTVRVDTKRLDDIMNLVGELVLVRNRLATLKSSLVNEEVAQAVANLDLVTSDLQNAVMKTRMQPIKKVFGRFPRVVRDLARNLKKEVVLELQGEDTDLDKNLVEALADPLVHLVRNAVDHGIEAPHVREARGKSPMGTVILTAQQEGDHILLSIEDDGAGMDPEVLRRKAVEKGIMDTETAARMDDRACYNIIFLPGFSTKAEISDVSGRGVGMDVVKTRISQLNGSIEIDSKLDRGSRFVIKVPLTLAIMPTLMIMLDRQIFAMPLVNVNEIFSLDSARTNIVDGQLTVIVRNKAVPLFYLREWLVDGAGRFEHRAGGYVVVITVGTQHIGCVVEQLIGQEEVVVKPLGALLHGTRGVAGATITGNGRIALILDFPGLIDTYARRRA